MIKKIKICFICLGVRPLFEPKDKRTFGGAEVQLALLGKALAGFPDFEISFVVADVGQDSVETYGKIKLHKGIKMEKYLSIFRRLAHPKPLALAYLMRKINPDIFIQRSASAGTGLICFMAHLLKKKFVYMTAHEIDCNGEFEAQNRGPKGKFFQYGIRHADLVVTQSAEHRRMIRAHHGRESVVIKSMYKIPPESDLQDVDKDIILWVGRVEDWKQPEVFIELASHFPKEKFVMVAPASNNQPTYYEKVKRWLESAPNVEHIHYVPFSEIDGYFRRAKVYILTSRYEGFPNTFVQAAKNKTPILSLSVNPDGMLERYGCGLFADHDPGQMKGQLEMLLKNPDLRKAYGEKGFRYAKQHHDIVHIADRYKAIFRKL